MARLAGALQGAEARAENLDANAQGPLAGSAQEPPAGMLGLDSLEFPEQAEPLALDAGVRGSLGAAWEPDFPVFPAVPSEQGLQELPAAPQL